MSMPILHICAQEAWEAAKRSGEYRADSLAIEGFIHCSTTDQVAGSADRFYRGRQNLLLLVIDPEQASIDVRYELAGDGRSYPHIYGPLPISAVIRTLAYAPGEDGCFPTPDLT